MGVPALVIGTYCWVAGAQRKREAYKINVASIPFKQFKMGNIYLEPNINYLSCRLGDKKGALGFGAKISF